MGKKYFWVFHLLLIINLTITYVYSVEKGIKKREKIFYRYKKNQKIDLGELSVEGQNMVPGDLTVRERKRHNSKENIFEKKDFEKEIKEDFNFFTRRIL